LPAAVVHVMHCSECCRARGDGDGGVDPRVAISAKVRGDKAIRVRAYAGHRRVFIGLADCAIRTTLFLD
jgi:hypothetical protein